MDMGTPAMGITPPPPPPPFAPAPLSVRAGGWAGRVRYLTCARVRGHGRARTGERDPGPGDTHTSRQEGKGCYALIRHSTRYRTLRRTRCTHVTVRRVVVTFATPCYRATPPPGTRLRHALHHPAPAHWRTSNQDLPWGKSGCPPLCPPGAPTLRSKAWLSPPLLYQLL